MINNNSVALLLSINGDEAIHFRPQIRVITTRVELLPEQNIYLNLYRE